MASDVCARGGKHCASDHRASARGATPTWPAPRGLAGGRRGDRARCPQGCLEHLQRASLPTFSNTAGETLPRDNRARPHLLNYRGGNSPAQRRAEAAGLLSGPSSTGRRAP